MIKINLPLMILLIVVNCSPIWADDDVQLWITSEFQNKLIQETSIQSNGKSVMDITKDAAKVDTSFGGGFLTSIDDIGGEYKDRNKSWMYYINGVLANVGALEYIPSPSDIVWWDYHRWDSPIQSASLIGAYPQPFKSGYSQNVPPTVILFGDGFEDDALKLQRDLLSDGVQVVEAQKMTTSETLDSSNARIILADWDQVKSSQMIQNLFKNYEKTGLSVSFDKGSLNLMSADAKIIRTAEKGAFIEAVSFQFQPERPALWLILGNDQESIHQAVDILTDHERPLKYFAGAFINQSQFYPLPYDDNK